MLDRARRHQRRLRLLDLYSSLLTEHQRRIMHLAWEEDWSYGEIAAEEGVSRTAVYDIVRRTAQALETYERKLGLNRERARRLRSMELLRRRLGGLERELARLIARTA
jgi:predicted DNA-binding protein YlxM (UPF0122 family)